MSHTVIRACGEGINIDSGTFGKMQSGRYTSSHATLSTTHEEAALVFTIPREEIIVPQRSRAKDLGHMGIGFELNP